MLFDLQICDNEQELTMLQDLEVEALTSAVANLLVEGFTTRGYHAARDKVTLPPEKLQLFIQLASGKKRPKTVQEALNDQGEIKVDEQWIE